MFDEYHWAWTARLVWSTVRRSLNMWTICRLVLYSITHRACSGFMAGLPVYLVWRGILFCVSCFGVVLTLVILYARERMSSMWVIYSWYYKYSCSICYLKRISAPYLFKFSKNDFFFVMFLSAFNGFNHVSKLISCQTVVFYPCILVLRCRRRCLLGGVPGGGCWATL